MAGFHIAYASRLTLSRAALSQAAADGENLFITGSGGVGKSALLKHMIRNTLGHRQVEVTAYTGVAALPIGGTTLHSFLGIRPGDFKPMDYIWMARAKKQAKQRMRRAEVLVIDEISMCDAHLLNIADLVLKNIRDDPKPFGGVQLILLGDFLQLPPPKNDYKLCYESQAWRRAKIRIYALTKVFRQEDEELIGHLNAVRMGDITTATSLYLQRFIRKPEPGAEVTELYSHNSDVDRLNAEELIKLHTQKYTYDALDTGSPFHVKFLQRNCIAPTQLKLKVGAKVMLLKNRPKDGLVNGSIGTVVKTKFDTVTVSFRAGEEHFDVEFEPEKWEYIVQGKCAATRSQIPLRLAYAQTIHKSQGQTLQAAYIDMNRIFAQGHGYTALSRVVNPEGLHLSGFNPLMVRTCPRTVGLYQLIAKKEPGFCLADTPGSVKLQEAYRHPERTDDRLQFVKKTLKTSQR